MKQLQGEVLRSPRKCLGHLNYNRSREGHGENAGEFAEVEKVSWGQGEKEESGCQEMTLGFRPTCNKEYKRKMIQEEHDELR